LEINNLPSLRNYFKVKEIGSRLQSYISPIINFFKSNNSNPNPPTKEILTKSLEVNAGMETELENPDSLLENKSKDLRFYDTMAADDKVKSCLELKKRLALSSSGDVVPASDEEQDKQIADFCKWQFDNMRISFYDILDNYLDGMQYGFKVGELVWANQERMESLGKIIPPEFNGKWFIENIKHKHSIFFDFKYNDYGDVESLYIGRNFGGDIDPISGEELKNKFLIFTYPYPRDGNYYGDSDLKEIYPQWYAKFNIFRFRNQYLERYGMPIPEIIYDATKTTADEKSDLNLMLKNFQDCMYFLTPGAYSAEAKDIIGKFKIQLHEVRNGSATDQYENAIDQIDKQIARKLLIPDKLGFSETTTGSYSLGETQYKMFVAVIEDLQHRLEELVNKLIVRVVDFNYYGIKDYPTWQFAKLSEHVKEEMLKILLEKGVIDKREKWIRKYVGIPEIDEKEQEEIDEAKEEDIKRAQENIQNQNPFQPGVPNQQRPGGLNPKNKPMVPKQPEKKFKRTEMYFNFKQAEKNFDTAEAEFIRDYNEIWMDNTKYLLKQVESKKITEAGDIKKVEELKIKKTELRKLFQNYFTKLYLDGRIDAIEEIQGRLRNVVKGDFKLSDLPDVQMKVYEYLDRDYVLNLLRKYDELGKLTEWDGEGFKLIKDRAYINAGNTEKQMLEKVGNTIYEGIRNNKTTKEITQNISKILTDDLQKYKTTIARTGASDFYNSGRMNLFNSKSINPYITAYQYIAIIDNATTEFCNAHDEQIIQANDPQLSIINPPNHFNCRSILSPIFLGENQQVDNYYYNWEENFSAWGTGVPVAARVPSKGFGG
jgi:SPP1 gp7 family putative phage head morphogenesis protein